MGRGVRFNNGASRLTKGMLSKRGVTVSSLCTCYHVGLGRVDGIKSCTVLSSSKSRMYIIEVLFAIWSYLSIFLWHRAVCVQYPTMKTTRACCVVPNFWFCEWYSSYRAF